MAGKKETVGKKIIENKGVLKLSRPLEVNGSYMHEIPYDFDAMTAEDIITLDKGRLALGLSVTVSQELDPYSQFALFVRAAIRADNALDEMDLKRLSARDALKAQRLGRDFFLADETAEDSEDAAPESSAG